MSADFSHRGHIATDLHNHPSVSDEAFTRGLVSVRIGLGLDFAVKAERVAVPLCDNVENVCHLLAPLAVCLVVAPVAIVALMGSGVPCVGSVRLGVLGWTVRMAGFTDDEEDAHEDANACFAVTAEGAWLEFGHRFVSDLMFQIIYGKKRNASGKAEKYDWCAIACAEKSAYNPGMDYDSLYNRNRITWLYEAARSNRLSATDVRVGLLFATFVQPEMREEVKPSYEWLMANAGIGSRSTLAKSIRNLEKAGFLVVTRYHRYRSHYSLPFDGESLWFPPAND